MQLFDAVLTLDSRSKPCALVDTASSSSLYSSIMNLSSGISQLYAIHQALENRYEPTPFQQGAQLQPLPDAQNVFVTTSTNSKMHPSQPPKNVSLLEDASLFDSPDNEECIFSPDPVPLPTQGSDGSLLYLHQEDRWDEHYQRLLRYKAEHGHCVIPQNYPKDLIALARWCRRQRHQYKRKKQNKSSSMSDTRQRLLDQAGFVWDPQTDVWEIRFQELKDYKRRHGDCNVPARYPLNPQLASWVKRQRRQYKEMQSGRLSRLPRERLARLNNLGFVWQIRSPNASLMSYGSKCK